MITNMTGELHSDSDLLEGIAVVGMSGRFPGAPDVDTFWDNLRNGVESIHQFSDEELVTLGVPAHIYTHPNYVKASPILPDIDMFDAGFFGYTPREASVMDPQQRLFLECAWAAMENSGYSASSPANSVGVYAGVGVNHYSALCSGAETANTVSEIYQQELGNEKDFVSTRVSYKLDLRGPSITVQTACSTSLVAVHMACQALWTYQCDMALAGGCGINVMQSGGYFYQEGMIPSPDGHCRAFDAEAKGTVLGKGVGVVVLKRLSDALADRDTIHAVIRGSAVNNDGAGRVGFTAPSVDGQSEVIAAAQALAGVEPDNIGYIEAHGTGTPLGDPIEIKALTQVFRAKTDKIQFCPIGSVKTNVGHLDAAAGVTGLIKTIFMLKHKQIPPSLNFRTPNPNINFENSPFYVNVTLQDWASNGGPRLAGVSSFGLGGTNAHVIVEEAPPVAVSSESRPWQLLLLSARTTSALDSATTNLAAFLGRHPDTVLADAAYSLQVGRRRFEHRRMLVCENVQDAVAALSSAGTERMVDSTNQPAHRDVVFMFSGQGSQYANMGRELYEIESVFKDTVDACSEILKPELSRDLRDLIFPSKDQEEQANKELSQTAMTQPALFTVEYALAKLWMSWGIEPRAMVGHSIGEYVVACLAGVFSLEDGLALIAERGRLMQRQPTGSMLAVAMSEKDLSVLLDDNVNIAAVNGPSMCVVSGETPAIQKVDALLAQKNIICRQLHTSHAFHSPMMAPILQPFAERVRSVVRKPPSIPFLSNVTGTWITDLEATDPEYWARHLGVTVRFADCLDVLLSERDRILLEVGPGRALTSLAKQHPGRTASHLVLSSTRHPRENRSDLSFILESLGRLWMAGVDIDWAMFYEYETRRRIPVPSYPFERKRYWIDTARTTAAGRRFSEGKIPHERETSTTPEIHTRKDLAAGTLGASENFVQQTLHRIWTEVLGLAPTGINDDFFDLGGNSLAAAELFSRIERAFGKRLPLSTLYQAPTIRKMAAHVGTEMPCTTWKCLVKIQGEGSRPPLFLAHGAGGNVLVYRELAHRLGNYQPVYGLQSRGLDGTQPLLTSIEDMAACYLSEIRTVQAHGPYLLGGYCMGGTIAIEMARQLRSDGETVALLALFETYDFSRIGHMSMVQRAFHLWQRIGFHALNFLLLSFKQKRVFIKEKAKVLKGRLRVWGGMLKRILVRTRHMNGDSSSALFDIWATNDRAAFAYVAKPIDVRIVQFLAKRDYACHRGPGLRLDNLARNGSETHRLPVYPAGMMVEPFVQLLAERLNESIDQVLAI